MSHYQRQLVFPVPRAAVYRALATQQGLRSWWTQDCEVSDVVGGEATFRFNRVFKVMRIERLVPDREVLWRCVRAQLIATGVDNPEEWVGTLIRFELHATPEGATRLEFEHRGLVPALQCHALCSRGWDQYLQSLGQALTSGQGTPFAAPLRAAQA